MATPSNKKITEDQIAQAAAKIGVEKNVLKAIMTVECKASGFNDDDGTPVILFERHIFWQQLIAAGKKDIAVKACKENPDICNPLTSISYGKFSAQAGRQALAVKYDRQAALESASYGLGQVLGKWWSDLGYKSIQEFINAAYKDEASQLDIMCRFLVKNGVVPYMKSKNWAMVARKYNGKNYARFQYDIKLEKAYNALSGK